MFIQSFGGTTKSIITKKWVFENGLLRGARVNVPAVLQMLKGKPSLHEAL